MAVNKTRTMRRTSPYPLTVEGRAQTRSRGRLSNSARSVSPSSPALTLSPMISDAIPESHQYLMGRKICALYVKSPWVIPRRLQHFSSQVEQEPAVFHNPETEQLINFMGPGFLQRSVQASSQQPFQNELQQELVDIMSTCHLLPLVDVFGKEHCIEYRENGIESVNIHPWLQFMVRDIYTSLFCVENQRQQFCRAIAIAESAKALQLITSDDFCYHYLSEWAIRDTQSNSASLIRIDFYTEGGVTTLENHTFLLVNCSADFRPVPPELLNQIFIWNDVNPSIDQNDAWKGYWIVDPVLNKVTPLDGPQIKLHTLGIIKHYGYTSESHIELHAIEHLSKRHPIDTLSVSASKQQGQQVMVIAMIEWGQQHYERTHRSERTFMKFINYHLKRLPFKPNDAWPNKFRSMEWRNCHVRCIAQSLSDSQGSILLEIEPASDFDILMCFQTDIPEYINALVRQITIQLAAGVCFKDCIEKMSTIGFRGNSSAGLVGDTHFSPYLIPAFDGIPENLWDTERWAELQPDHWTALGIDTCMQPPLKETIERFITTGHENRYASARVHICQKYAHLWNDNPFIKSAVKSLKPKSKPLLRFLMHCSKVNLPHDAPKSYHWSSMDSLMICSADTTPHRTALLDFLQDCLTKKMNAHEIAKVLVNGNTHMYSDELRLACQVELPRRLLDQGCTQWNGESVARLINDQNIAVPEGLILLPEYSEFDDLKKTVQTWFNACKAGTASALSAKFTNHLKTKNGIANRISTCLELDPDKVKQGIPAATRVILKKFEISCSHYAQKDQKKLEIKPADMFNMSCYESPLWKEQLLLLVKGYLEKGHTLSYIAYRLKSGDKNPLEFTFNPVPLPLDESQKEQLEAEPLSYDWTYANLLHFLDENDADLEMLIKAFPCSAGCLNLENELFQNKTVHALTDGILIDRMLSPVYNSIGEKESNARLWAMSKCIKELIPIKGAIPLMAHYNSLKKQISDQLLD